MENQENNQNNDPSLEGYHNSYTNKYGRKTIVSFRENDDGFKITEFRPFTRSTTLKEKSEEAVKALENKLRDELRGKTGDPIKPGKH